MSDLKEKHSSSKVLGRYFTNIEPYSAEHIQDIEKFARLLETLQESQKSINDKRAFAEIGIKIRDLNDYLLKNDMTLNDREKKQINAIAGSSSAPSVAKRMIEDLIYKIRQRIERELQYQREKDAFEEEIYELQDTGLKIVNWFRMTLFAFEYGTITLFSHNLRFSALSLLQEKGHALVNSLVKGIRPLLDSHYYLFSIREYNSLELFLHLAAALEKIKAIDYRSSYESEEIAGQMEDFSIWYLTLIKNCHVAEAALEKAYKIRKAPHGFWGDFYDFTGKPIYRNRHVKLTDFEEITGTISGVLKSYYSTRLGVLARTFNQLLYLSKTDGELEIKKKLFTGSALADMEKNRKEQNSLQEKSQKRFDELNRILMDYIPRGKELSVKLLMKSFKTPVPQWKKECEKRPMLCIRKLVEAYIQHFIDPILDNHIKLVYDNREFTHYFESNHSLVGIARSVNLVEFDLVGSKDKDFGSLETPEGASSQQLIYSLTAIELPKSALDSRMVLARTILQKISNKSYQLALALHELITKYYDLKKLAQADVTENYDFFFNAEIKKQAPLHFFGLVQKEKVTLQDFMESACAVAFYLADFLNNSGVETIKKERDALLRQMEKEENKDHVVEQKPREQESHEEGEEVSSEIDRLYRDPITGLWNYQYLVDQILPRYYDDEEKYRHGDVRFVFICEIDDFVHYNTLWGHDVGDEILAKVTHVLCEHFNATGENADTVIARYERDMIVGYIQSESLSAVVDSLVKIRKDINALIFNTSEGEEIANIALKAGVYQERKGSHFLMNIKIVRAIMRLANMSKTNMVGFTTDQHRIIYDKDFDSYGNLDGDIITVV